MTSTNNEKAGIKQSSGASMLHAAIEHIEGITASNSDLLDKMKSLARNFTFLFSSQAREEEKQKLTYLEQAKNIIESHSLLIDKLQQGTASQQKWAQRAFEAINRYNKIANRYQLSQIQLQTSNSTFKELSKSLSENPKKECMINLSHKKNIDAMKDVFKIKANRLMQLHLPQNPHIINLIKQTDITFDIHPNLIEANQVLEIEPGFIVKLTGTFNKQSPLMGMPILEDLQFDVASFPY